DGVGKWLSEVRPCLDTPGLWRRSGRADAIERQRELIRRRGHFPNSIDAGFRNHHVPVRVERRRARTALATVKAGVERRTAVADCRRESVARYRMDDSIGGHP